MKKLLLVAIVCMMSVEVYASEGIYFTPVYTLVAIDSTTGDTTSRVMDVVDSLSGIRVPENLTFYFATVRTAPGVETTEITIQSSYDGTVWHNVGQNDAILDLNSITTNSTSLFTAVTDRYYRIDINATADTTEFSYAVKVVGFTYEGNIK